MTEIGTIIDGKYEVLKEIGRGGMSTVYLAMDRRLNKQWAVKEIRKKGTGANDEIVVNSLLAEANLMKRLDHPALPRIVDIIDNGITIYVVMDYIEGESLDKILKEYGVQDEEKVIEWAKQVCDALSYLHSQKPRPIVYRDMKPANIMLKPEGNIKIIDFGIAREYKEQNLADTKVLGTRGFAPPEAYNGQTTPRSDIYSLGMTMHNLLTGVDPRMGDGYVPVRQINPNLSEGIELIIDKCVQPAEENRYQSCADLIYDLEHPDLITSGYKKKQKSKVIATAIPLVLSIIMAFSGIGTALGAKYANESNYGTYTASTSLEDYEKAIALYPDRPKAYEKIAEYYRNDALSDEGFTEKDYMHIKEIWNKNKEKLREANPEAYANFNYEIGRLCFIYLQTDSIVTRCNHASEFFTDTNTNIGTEFEYENKYMADRYTELCTYQSTINNPKAVEQADFETNKKILSAINETMDVMEEDPNVTDYEVLAYNEMVFVLLKDVSDNLAKTGIPKKDVLDLCEKLNRSSGKISVSENKKKLLQLQNTVTNEKNYELTIASIVRSYDE